MGYPQLSALINSDVNFLMYRRFGYLRNRVLLHKQDELAMLEQQLKELDDLDDEEDHFRIRSRKYDSRHGVSARERLIGEINDKLKEYGKQLWSLVLIGSFQY